MIDSEVMLADMLKLRVSQEALVEKLALVARAVSTRTAVLVLGGIRLKVENGQLELAATDMELSLRTTLEADVDGEGEVVVPGRLLLDIVRSLPAAEVSIEQRSDESVLLIDAGSASYRLHTYSSEDFPRLPDVESVELHQVDREALLETIGRVGRSASRDESRPVLTGILVQFEPGKLVMAATDSYRLAVKETPLSSTLGELDAIIPARALQELARIAANADEMQLGVHENHVVFGIDGAWLTTRRIDGQFPNYRQLLPEQFEHELHAAARGASRRRSPRLADGPAQLAAAPPLRRRRADRVGADAGRRRGARVDRGAVRGRHDGDRLQRRLPPRGARVGRLADRALQADQPAAPGRPRGRERRLHLPDHADQARRLTRLRASRDAG